jgi:hypothetical protein
MTALPNYDDSLLNNESDTTMPNAIESSWSPIDLAELVDQPSVKDLQEARQARDAALLAERVQALLSDKASSLPILRVSRAVLGQGVTPEQLAALLLEGGFNTAELINSACRELVDYDRYDRQVLRFLKFDSYQGKWTLDAEGLHRFIIGLHLAQARTRHAGGSIVVPSEALIRIVAEWHTQNNSASPLYDDAVQLAACAELQGDVVSVEWEVNDRIKADGIAAFGSTPIELELARDRRYRRTVAAARPKGK